MVFFRIEEFFKAMAFVHLNLFQHDVDGGDIAEVHHVGMDDVLDVADAFDDLPKALIGDMVADDEQVVDTRIEFQTKVVFVFQGHQVIGVAVFTGIVVEESVGQNVVQ